MSRRSRSQHDDHAPGWVWMLFGLGLGLLVALGVYFTDTRAPERAEPVTVREESPPQPEEPEAPSAARSAESAEDRFEFYEILPEFEVEIPDAERPNRRRSATTPAPRAVEEPGSYVLQAGSFTSLGDADRLQASLALLGIESRIQRVTIDDAVYHRVRIGPISDLDQLNRVRRQLRDAKIEPLLMKAAD